MGIVVRSRIDTVTADAVLFVGSGATASCFVMFVSGVGFCIVARIMEGAIGIEPELSGVIQNGVPAIMDLGFGASRLNRKEEFGPEDGLNAPSGFGGREIDPGVEISSQSSMRHGIAGIAPNANVGCSLPGELATASKGKTIAGITNWDKAIGNKGGSLVFR